MVARLDLPVGPVLVKLLLVMLVKLGTLLFGHLANSWRPNEDCHDVVAADPALVFLAGEDAPLSHTWHQIFVPELPLNDQFFCLNTRHLCARIADPHRLHDVPQFEPLPDILPLVILDIFRRQLD